MQPNTSSRRHVATVLPHGLDAPPKDTPPPVSEGEISLADLVSFFRRHWRLVAFTSLAAGVLVALLALALTPSEYKAIAMLAVATQGQSSELQPPVMSIQGFQRLLESDAIVDQTINRLINDEKFTIDAKSLDIGDELQTQIYVSRRSDVTALAPVIELIASDASANKAATIANTWANVFLERSQALQKDNTKADFKLVKDQFEISNNSVVKLAEERLGSADDFEAQITELKVRWRRQLDKAKTQWDRKLVQFENETEDLIALFQLETRREMEDQARNHGLTMGGKQANLSPEARKQLLQIMTRRIQLAQTLQFLSLEKAISNDALWQLLFGQDKEIVGLETANWPSLQSQEINTVYTQLAEDLSNLEVTLEEMVEGNDAVARRITAEMEERQRQRSASLLKLYIQRSQQHGEMQAQKSRDLEEINLERSTELEALKRLSKTRLDQMDRNLRNAETLFEGLAKRLHETEIAREAQSPEMFLAAEAVPRHDPQSRQMIPKTVVGLFAGALLGCLIAVLRETKNA